MTLITFLRRVGVCGCFWLLLILATVPTTVRAAVEPGVVDQTKEKVKEATTAVTEVAQDAKASVQDAGRSAADSFKDLWSRVDEGRLKNRTRDELVAWLIMGALVGAVAGMFTSLKTSGAGKLGRFLLGLAGALIGGMVVHAAQINFGWGPVLIRYEELLFSLVGAILLIVVTRLIRSRVKKKPVE